MFSSVLANGDFFFVVNGLLLFVSLLVALRATFSFSYASFAQSGQSEVSLISLLLTFSGDLRVRL